MKIPILDYLFQNIIIVHDEILKYLIFILCIILLFFITIIFDSSFTRINTLLKVIGYRFSVYWKTWKRPRKQRRDATKIFVSYLLYRFKKTHNLTLEMVWTTVPIIITLELIYPSISLLSDDEIYNNTSLATVSVIGNQWYWDYELHFGSSVKTTNSNLIVLEEGNSSQKGFTKLLATTESVMIPVGMKIIFYITSNDVIHSFAIPGLGVKIDAIPGRINYKNVIATRLGLYTGMCSELCGINHGYMPISLKTLSRENFIYMLNTGNMVVKNSNKWDI